MSEIIDLPLPQIYSGPKVRNEQLDLDHVALLQGVEMLPPISVRKTAKGYECLDGGHRTAARRMDKHETIRGVVLELDDAEALEFAYSANNDHGLPLTMAERKHGARRFIAETHLSDASIAKIVGLHRDTVAKMRGVQVAVRQQPEHRDGSDGKTYPASPAVAAAARRRAEAAYEADPSLSVRDLAKNAQCSNGVAHDVITAAKIAGGSAPAPDSPAPSDPAPVPCADEAGQTDDAEGPPSAPQGPALGVDTTGPSDPTVGELVANWPTPGQWRADSGFQLSNDAREFARLMDRRLIRSDESDVGLIAAACPADQRTRAAAAAESQIAYWSALARSLTNPTALAPVEEA